MCNKKKRTSLNLKKIGRRFLVGLLAMAMTSTMVPALQGMAQSVDASVVAQEEYDCYLDENFSRTNGWSISGDTASLIDTTNGILKLGSSGKAKYGTSTLSYDGETYYSMKFRFPKTDTAKANRFALHLRNGVYRYYTNIEVGEDKIRIQDRQVTNGVRWYDCTIENNVWYEILFAFKGTEEGNADNFSAADIYLRTVDGNGAWEQLQTTAEDGIHRLLPTTDTLVASITLEGHSSNSLSVEVDDVRFFKGNYRKLSEPRLENSQFVTDGEYVYADVENDASRKATLLAVAYDKSRGYTVKVWQKDYDTIESSTVQRLDNRFDASGIVVEDTDIAVMLWESVESGVPLTAAVGTVPQSTGSASAETLSYKISYNDVLVYGNAGTPNDDVTISLSDDNGVQAVTQTKSDANGMIQAKLGINPYTCTGESYTLRVQCGTEVAKSYPDLKLLTQAKLPQNGFENVDALKTFVEVYGSEAEKKCMAEGHGEDVYQYLEERYAEDGTLYNDVFTFLSALEEAATLYLGTVDETLDASVVAQEEYVCYLDDDFSTSKDWRVSGDTVSLIDTTNGVLKLGSTGKAKQSTSTFSYDGEAYYSMKFCFPKTDAGKANRFALHLRNGVYRYYTNVEVGDDKIRIQDRQVADGVRWYDCTIKNNVWYEILFAFKGKEEGNADNFAAADIYLRTVDGNGSWKQLRTTAGDGVHRLFPTTDSLEASITLEGYSNNTLLVEFDDIRCYKGTYGEINEPKLEDNNLIVGGSYVYGNPSVKQNRRATILAAAYDKKYGYTTRVWEKDYSKIKPGTVQDLSNRFEANEISENNEDIAVMLWESVESGVPLLEAKGVMPGNMEIKDDVSAEALSYRVIYNEVVVSGYTGTPNDDVTVSLKGADGVKAITQTKSDLNGMVKVKLGINPYTCVDDSYTLRIQSGTMVAQAYPGIKLLTKSQVPSNGFADLNSFLLFVQTYCDGVQDEWVTLGLENEVFHKFNQLSSEDYQDFYLFRNAITKAGENAIADFNLLKEVNAAGNNWKKLEQLLLVDYREHLGLSENEVDHLDVKALFTKVCGTYSSVDDLMSAFRKAKKEEEDKKNFNYGSNGTTGAIGGAGGFGGGGSAGAAGGDYGGGVGVQKEALPESNEEVKEVVIKDGFRDLEAVSWAEDSILALQAEGIIAGDGQGMFYPDRPITREEFLKLVMLATGISVKTDKDVPFDDVALDAWYHPYVAVAYQMGIVKGVTEIEFGIGKQITRGDMAVIIDRTLTCCNIVPSPTKAAFVFDDYYNIPSYAAKSIALLCEADLMHGVGDNLFMAEASATRAEAAVAIYNIYRYVKERR